MTDHYQTLHVSREAPPAVIKAAYKALAQNLHPDKNPGAGGRMAAVNEAYRVLSDPVLRKAYDALLTRESEAESGPEPAPRREPQPQGQPGFRSVTGSAAGHGFVLQFFPGRIISNDTWNETKVSQDKRGKVSSKNIRHQRFGVSRDGYGDVFLKRENAEIPLALGQRVELVLALKPSEQSGYYVALLNHSSRQWHWLDSPGRRIRSSKAWWRDKLRFCGVFPVLYGGWEIVRHLHSTLLSVLFFVVGVPWAWVWFSLRYSTRTTDALDAEAGRLIREEFR